MRIGEYFRNKMKQITKEKQKVIEKKAADQIKEEEQIVAARHINFNMRNLSRWTTKSYNVYKAKVLALCGKQD